MSLKLEPPVNPNYAATVVTIRSLIPLNNCDNLVAVNLLGYQAIVSKDTKVGDVGVLFTAETQLSYEYAYLNNLHRHSDKNVDETQKGYLEDSRRVKALKLRGHRSDALFMPLSSVLLSSADYQQVFSEGDTFDKINGHEICRKYVRPGSGKIPVAGKEKIARVDQRMLPEHTDTENYFRNSDKIPQLSNVTVTQKLHGTSIRVGNVVVQRKLSFWERVAQKFGVKVQEVEYAYVYGSRKVIKDPHNPHQNHFYGEDLYTHYGKTLDGLLPKGYVVYGELIGWTTAGSPIQKDYTYKILEGAASLYIYRVTYVNPDGLQADLSWEGVKEFCTSRGLNHVVELWSGKHSELTIENFLDINFSQDLPEGVPLPTTTVDEGVCVRLEGVKPYILKAKSPAFLRHETRMLDKDEVVDMEEDQESLFLNEKEDQS